MGKSITTKVPSIIWLPLTDITYLSRKWLFSESGIRVGVSISGGARPDNLAGGIDSAAESLHLFCSDVEVQYINSRQVSGSYAVEMSI
jgi:hypothetical protein